MSNDRRNSMLMTCHYPDLVSAVIGWKIASTNQKHYPDLGSEHVISMEFLHTFLRRHFVRKTVVASRNVGCFHRLIIIFNSLFFLSGDSSAATGSVRRTGKSQGANSGICQTGGTGRRTASWEGQFTYLIRTRIRVSVLLRFCCCFLYQET